MKIAAALLCLSLGATAAAQEAAPAVAGSAEAGATKAAVCTACHGVNGNSVNPEWPSLAGQNAAYVREQLELFKAKKRNNPIMQPIIDGIADCTLEVGGFGHEVPFARRGRYSDEQTVGA